MPNCAETSPFSPIKHLIRLKTDQNRRFILWKCAVSGYVWKCPGWTLRVFMHLYECLHHFWTFFEVTFDLFVTTFWAILTLSGAIQCHFWDHDRVIFGPFWHRFGVILMFFDPFGRCFWAPFFHPNKNPVIVWDLGHINVLKPWTDFEEDN